MNILLYRIVDTTFQIAYMALLIRVLLSWIPHNPYHPIISFIKNITDPILRPFQDLIPSYKIGIDLSPILAFLALGMIRKIILQLLF